MVVTEATEINITEMKERAKSLGIDPEEMKETELIHSIQIAEDCTPCFGTSSGQCDQFDCCFMQSCLQSSLKKSSQAEEHFQQQKSKLTTANEQLQEQYTKSEQAENKLKKHRKQFEQSLSEQTKKLTAANKRTQNKIAEHEQAENKLKKRSKQLAKRVREQGEELTAANKQFRCEFTKQKKTENDITELYAKLDETNFFIRMYLKHRNIMPEDAKNSNSLLNDIAEFFGWVCGSFDKALIQ